MPYIKQALRYGDEHPTPELLGHLHRNIQSFYDAGGYITIRDKTRSDIFDTNIIHSNGEFSIMKEFKAHTPDGQTAGKLNVNHLVANPDIVREINEKRLSEYNDKYSDYQKKLEEYTRKKKEKEQDPWTIAEDSDYLGPREPQKLRLLPVPGVDSTVGPDDLKYWAHPGISSEKLIPGTGSALQHALTVYLKPLGIGVDSGYAQSARTFHRNVGRRVDWEWGTEPGQLDPSTISYDGHGTGTSIWLPSDIEKIASLPIKNYNVKNAKFLKTSNMFKYEEDDWNPDEVETNRVLSWKQRYDEVK